MYTYFQFYATYMPWPALVMLLIIMTRLPRIIKRPFLYLIDKILFLKLQIGSKQVTLYWFVMVWVLLTFLSCINGLKTLPPRPDNQHHINEWKERKNRAERNFWISLLCLCLYVTLHRFRHYIKRYEEQKDIIAALEKEVQDLKAKQVETKKDQ